MRKEIKIAIAILLTSVVAAIIHNAIYALFNFEEPVFFLISVLSIPAFFVYIIVVSFKLVKNR